MKVICYGGNSSGNCYEVIIEGRHILLDCGVPYSTMIKHGFKISKCRGALVTHTHGDHAGNCNDFIRRGIDVYVNEHTKSSRELDKAITYEENKPFMLRNCLKGRIYVTAFPLVHDVPCHGFYVQYSGTSFVYITDTGACNYRFKFLDYILIEANHDTALVEEAYKHGDMDNEQYEHIVQGHFSIEKAIAFVKANKNKHLKAVLLLHKSRRHARDTFAEELQAATGVKCYTMESGVIYG